MSYTFIKGKYRTYVRSSFEDGGHNGKYSYSEYYPFECENEPEELYTFRTNRNIQINPVTLEVPGATLDRQIEDCLLYSNGLEVITGPNISNSIDHSVYKYIYIAFDNSSGSRGHITYKIDYVQEVAYFGIPYIREDYYSSDGYGCDNFDGELHVPASGSNCYINLGTYAQYANSKNNIALSLFHNIPRLSIENLENLVQSNVVVTAAMFFMCGGFTQNMFEVIRDTWDMSNVLSVDYMFTQNPAWYELDRISGWQLEIIQNISTSSLVRAQYTLSGTHISYNFIDSGFVFSKENNMLSLSYHFSASDIRELRFDPAKICFNAHCRSSAYWDNDEDGYAYMCASCASLTSVSTPANILSNSIISSSYPLTFKGMFLNCSQLLGIEMPEIQSTSTDTYGAAINFIDFASGCTNLRRLQIGAGNNRPIKLSARRINFRGAFNGCQNLQTLNFIIATANTICDFNEDTFVDCSSLTELNLNNMQARGYIFLDDCTSLTTLKCPQTSIAASRLPYTMYDSSGNAYSTIPENNITLYKINPLS